MELVRKSGVGKVYTEVMSILLVCYNHLWDAFIRRWCLLIQRKTPVMTKRFYSANIAQEAKLTPKILGTEERPQSYLMHCDPNNNEIGRAHV